MIELLILSVMIIVVTVLAGAMGQRAPLPPTVNCGAHDEDIDLSAAAGAIAAALKGGQLGFSVPSADVLRVPRSVRYLGYIYGDETATPDADGKVVIGNKRAYEIPFDGNNPHLQTEFWAQAPIQYTADDNIEVTGRSSGSGAEQHICAHFVDDPDLGPAFEIGSMEADTVIVVQAVTGTLVANTLSGFTDICGRDVAYAASQNKIAKSKDIKIGLLAVTPCLGAGYSAIGIRNPTGTRQLILPGHGGATTDRARRYNIAAMFGGPIMSNGQNPLEIGGLGVGTTAQAALLELALSGVGVDG